MFTTPPTASDPYIAEEPWDKISILSINPFGIVEVLTILLALF